MTLIVTMGRTLFAIKYKKYAYLRRPEKFGGFLHIEPDFRVGIQRILIEFVEFHRRLDEH